jgi:hypothetical protein
MIKLKRKRPTDSVQLAHSIFADVIKLSDKPIKAPSKPAIKPRRKQFNPRNIDLISCV